MKFEYKLNYDFISNELSFEITAMPESLRCTDTITTIKSDAGNTWTIKSRLYPQIVEIGNVIYLRGSRLDSDTKHIVVNKNRDDAFEVADVLKKFQRWLEDYSEEVVMTVAEIEEKLGIKNLKIVKEK